MRFVMLHKQSRDKQQGGRIDGISGPFRGTTCKMGEVLSDDWILQSVQHVGVRFKNTHIA
jgi:hypothetical protein